MTRITKHGEIRKNCIYFTENYAEQCKGGKPNICSKSKTCEQLTDRTCPILQAFDRLAEYEDTGLTPAEIIRLKETQHDLRS